MARNSTNPDDKLEKIVGFVFLGLVVLACFIGISCWHRRRSMQRSREESEAASLPTVSRRHSKPQLTKSPTTSGAADAATADEHDDTALQESGGLWSFLMGARRSASPRSAPATQATGDSDNNTTRNVEMVVLPTAAAADAKLAAKLAQEQGGGGEGGRPGGSAAW
ncbi:hypothetical protein FI667_g12899, partial [Globisporangium splendens]